MRLLRRKNRAKNDQQLYLEIHARKAKDLVISDDAKINRSVSPRLTAILNNKKTHTSRIKHNCNPNWDTVLKLPLVPYGFSNVVHLLVQDRHRRGQGYLGEVRLSVDEIFNISSESPFKSKTDLKWYKLYSCKFKNSFVTGSLLLSFELKVGDSRKMRRKSNLSKEISLSQTDNPMYEMTGIGEESTNSSSTAVSGTDASSDVKKDLLEQWLDSLVSCRYPRPDEQGFYLHEEGDFDLLDSDSDADLELSELNPKRRVPMKVHSIISNEDKPNQFLSPDIIDLKHNPSDDSSSSMMSATPQEYSDSGFPMKEPKKRRFRRPRRSSQQTHYELSNREVLGVVFLEIESVSDLPPINNLTRTRFDMDPFIVVSFGRRTYRTSWRGHTLNPIFNERVAFEILPHESIFSFQFSLLDKDRFSFNDKIASISLPILKLFPELDTSDSGIDSLSNLHISGDQKSSTLEYKTEEGESTVSVIDNVNTVKTVQRKKLGKKKIITYETDTSKFRTLELAMILNDPKYKEKYSPKLKIRIRFEHYSGLRKQFWKKMLEQSLDGEGDEFDFIELLVFLETLGSTVPDEVVREFFTKNDKEPWGGDTLSVDEIIECLEEFTTSPTTNQGWQLFKIERCPICGKERLSRKQDIDIITHVAICASKDWSIVSKLLVSSYVTPQHASKGWYSKFLLKFTYGKYDLGRNNANILVQDRVTGIIMEEQMSVYIRLGIRLLYKGFDKANSLKVRKMLKKLSIKQGIKFDSEISSNDIDSFIKFYNLDLSQCLLPLSDYKTFNQFFYRELKPNARIIEAKDNHGIAVSCADSRTTVFASINSATELWIKGRNFTIPKLLNGHYQNYYSNFENCSIGVFRLAPQDYHRFHSPVSGTIKKIKFIEGEYYTVNPMAIRSDLDVFGENVRCIIPIETKEFGTVIMIPVGAMMVGSIILTKNESDHVEKGEEIGYFKFGGSTVILLFQSQFFNFDSDLIKNSEAQVETLIRVGQSIGHRPDVTELKRIHLNFDSQSKDYKLNLMRVITGGGAGVTATSWETERLTLNDEELAISDEESDDYDDYDDEE